VGKTIHQVSTRRLSHGVNLYLSYAKEHWTHPDENPPVGLILCSSAGESIVRYTLDTLPSKVMAREYQLALPAVKKLEAELASTRKRLEQAGDKSHNRMAK
jgi:hypothetical protein